MIPDTRKRLEAAVEDLENYLVSGVVQKRTGNLGPVSIILVMLTMSTHPHQQQGVDEGGDDEVAKGSEAEAARQALDAAKQQTRGLQA